MAKIIDFSAKVLPDSHIWDTVEDGHRHDPVIEESIPTINLSNNPDDYTMILNQIKDACNTRGFFIVTNHGVSMDVIHRCEKECKRLFDLEPCEKMSVARKPTYEISSGYGSFLLSDCFSKSFWSESFYVVGSPLEHAKQLWPDDYQSFWYVYLCSNINSMPFEFLSHFEFDLYAVML